MISRFLTYRAVMFRNIKFPLFVKFLLLNSSIFHFSEKARGLQRSCPLENLGPPRRLRRDPRRLRKGPRGPLLSHKFVSKQLAELKWGPFRTRHKPAVDPLRSGVGPLRYETGPHRQEMGPLSTVMGPLRSGMGPLRSEIGPLRPGDGPSFQSMNPLIPLVGPKC